MRNRPIGLQMDLLGGPEVMLWSSGKPPREKAVKPLRARKKDPATSHETMSSLEAGKGNVQDRIFDAIDKHGPMTSHEIAERTGLSLVTVSPMIKPMRQAGILEDTGDRRGRRSVWGIAA